MKPISLLLSQCNDAVRSCCTLFRNVFSGLFIFCLIIHFWIKDGIDTFSIVYYSTPLPILACFSFAVGVIWLLNKRILVARICFLFTLASMSVWCYKSFFVNTRIPASSDVKLFFWNAARNRHPDKIAGHIQSFNADIVGIVETGIKKKKLSAWKNEFPGYELQVLTGGMALLTKGKVLSKKSGDLGERGHFNVLEVALNGVRFHILLVDIDGNPLRSRAPAFETLATLIRSYLQTDLIVMGDFNTPFDSVLFDSFRQELTHAFESGGHGFAGTWPIPLPILAIDHIWVSKKIKVVSCELNWSRHSDHRSMFASVEPPFSSISANPSR